MLAHQSIGSSARVAQTRKRANAEQQQPYFFHISSAAVAAHCRSRRPTTAALCPPPTQRPFIFCAGAHRHWFLFRRRWRLLHRHPDRSERLGVREGVATGQDTASYVQCVAGPPPQRLPLPVRNAATGAEDYGSESHVIVRLEVRLTHHVTEAACQQACLKTKNEEDTNKMRKIM